MLQELKTLIGKKLIYKKKEILVKNVKMVSGTYVILTDNRAYNFFENEISYFLKEIKELPLVKIENNFLEKRKMELEEAKKTTEIVRTENINLDIKAVLFDTIEKVRADKQYINQANAICNVVTQMINIQKLELSIKNKK